MPPARPEEKRETPVMDARALRAYLGAMETTPASDTPAVPELRRGWTTGACATAATCAALRGLWGGQIPDEVQITLPRGETPRFAIAHAARGDDWVECGVTKDAGDDPDVTHGALICVRVRASDALRFVAGEGVGTVTKPGLPIGVGEPAINPVPRQMMAQVVAQEAARHGQTCAAELTIRVPGGAALAARTWNPRLGIKGGLSILGTTGIVRPFSCAAWIASIHRGVDVARASGLRHVAGCTGATSESALRKVYDLPDEALLDMGDFAGGLLKYLRKAPVERLTIAGGIAKMTKLAQGARDLHSARSQVNFADLARALDLPDLENAPTALAAWHIAGPPMARYVADQARAQAQTLLQDAPVSVDVIVVDREGAILARAG